MPYRGADDINWRPAGSREWQVRAIAALALLVAGWGMGFVSGRLSAWLFPIEAATSAARPTPPDPTAAQAVKPPAVAQKLPPAAPSSGESVHDKATRPLALSPPPGDEPAARKDTAETKQAPPVPPSTTDGVVREWDSADTPPSDPPAPADKQPAAVSDPKSEPYRPAAGRIINPDGMKAEPLPARQPSPSATAETRNTGSEARMAECERRYTSFRRSDGTYQPFDRNTREICPLLR